MDNLYYGDILQCKCTNKKNNGFSTNNDILYLGGVYLVELCENRYVLLDELLSNKKDKQVFKTYAFSEGELYINYSSLIKVNDVMVEKYGRKL